MESITERFPLGVAAPRGVSSGVASPWMLVRWWRVLVRRALFLLVSVLFLYTTAALLVVVLPLARVPALHSTPYVVITLEQVAWLCVLAVALHAYCKRRPWLAGVAAALLVLLFLKGAAHTALHLHSLWCARPTFDGEYIFTVPEDVPCQAGVCTLRVAEAEAPPMCGVLHEYLHQLGVQGHNPFVVARVLLAQHVLHVLLGLGVVVHILEDQARLAG